jgi:hypothetical protein
MVWIVFEKERKIAQCSSFLIPAHPKQVSLGHTLFGYCWKIHYNAILKSICKLEH